MIAEYTFDSETRCWRRTGYCSIDYSDGDDLERRIFDTLRKCTDVSSTSGELARYIVDWPTEYHFSKSRHNLLRPLCIGTGSHVLELGCGCGSMTRFLGESGANVTAVEGSLLRAKISAERCRDLPNVQIVCDNLIDFDTSQRFDYVTLIGVLEYAPRYIAEVDPVAACLKKARSFLKPNGVLVLAIENQLGLKYFNGCDEDHLGTPYYGLHGLYRDDEPTTFGRAVLEKKLAMAGLRHHQFFYPFPDYKLPQVILADAALSTPDFDAAALLAGMASGNAEGEFYPCFHENLAWRPIIDNGLLPQLANSFLILATTSGGSLVAPEVGWLASAYTTSRIPAYATETRFTCSSKAVRVEKRCLFSAQPAQSIDFPVGGLLHIANTVCDYVVGLPYLVELQQRLARGEGVSGVIEWSASWFEMLLAHSSPNESGDQSLPGDWIDTIPQNCIRATDGGLRRIDQEWALDRSVPLHWVVVRGLSNSISFSPTSPALDEVRLIDLIVKVASANGICLTDEHIADAMQCESKLRTLIYGGNETENLERLGAAINSCCRSYVDAYLLGEHTRNEIADRDKEIARVKSTFSWQVTKPLRLLAFIWRMLNAKLWKTP